MGMPYTGGAFSIDNVSIPNSPLGGNNIARLQNAVGNGSVSGLAIRLRTTFPVNYSNSKLYFSYAGSWDVGSHGCCDQPSFQLQTYNCSGAVVNSATLNLTPSGSGCSTTGVNGYSVTGSSMVSWTNWQSYNLDLTQFVGSCVTIEIINADCSGGVHHGSVYFDAMTYSSLLVATPINCSPVQPVNFCANSSQANIFAPIGYASYQWYAPGTPPTPISPLSGGNSNILTLNNPLVGSIYTVQMVSYNGYTITLQDTIKFTTVSVAGIGSSSTICGGSSGSATVIATGSGTGYSYNWYAQGNPVPIGTGSVISNLGTGVYSVGVTALNSVGCGSAVATVTVGTIQSSTTIKYYCDTVAYLSAAPSASNIQWYNGLSAISSSLGGTAPGYTVTSPYTNQFFWVTYNSSSSCKDSVKMILAHTPFNGNLQISSNKSICAGSTNGQISLSLTPAYGSFLIANSFSVFAPSSPGIFTNSPAPYAFNTFTINNLAAGSIYTVNTFDGLCKHSTTLTPNIIPPINFLLSPLSSTLCQGNSVAASVIIPLASQHTFTWSPNIFISGNNPNTQSTVITPTAVLGANTTIIYTVAVTPTYNNCTVAKTLTVKIYNLQTPTINPVPTLCANANPFFITANPGGGTFTSTITGVNSGLIYPSLSGVGIHQFSYSLLPGTCVGGVSATFTIKPLPQVSISGNSLVCSGQSATLTASGADVYAWNNFSPNPSIIVSPILPTIYSVTGTNTLTTCSNTQQLYVNVNQSPVATILYERLSICKGESIILSALGNYPYYQWMDTSNDQNIEVSPDTTTSYILSVVDNNGCTDSAMVTVEVSACVGFKKLSMTRPGIKIYPNPAVSFLTVEIDTESELILYDQFGRVVLEDHFQMGEHRIDLRQYRAGLYILKCGATTNSSILKVVKTD